VIVASTSNFSSSSFFCFFFFFLFLCQTMKQTLQSKTLSDKVYELLAKNAEVTYKDIDPATLQQM